MAETCRSVLPARVSGWWLVCLVLLAGLLAYHGDLCFRAPDFGNVASVEPSGGDSASGFQLETAWQHLTKICGNGEPHPTGSLEITRVREYLIQEFVDLGYAVECEPSPPQNVWNSQASLYNIIARRASDAAAAQPAPILVFAAHYDSTPRGPGAGDDAAAVAAMLEVARIESQRAASGYDIVFLLTDGEEAGLLGAKHWVATCPWLDRVEWIFNFEARGTNGASFLFETSAGNQALIQTFAQVGPHPHANSLAYEVYRFMPNGTDFQIFKQAGLRGLNFAFVGNVQFYHTPQDTPENLDANSLAHHGHTMLELLNHYRQTESGLLQSVDPQANAVYFDVGGRWLWWWPQFWNWPWVGLNVFLFGVCVTYCQIGSLRDLVFGLLALFVVVAVMAVMIWISGVGLDQRQWLTPFWGRPIAVFGTAGALVVFWCIAVLSWAALGASIDCITKDKSLWVAVWGGWVILSIAVVTWVPGASYLCLIPTTAALVFRLLGWLCFRPTERLTARWVASAEMPQDAATDAPAHDLSVVGLRHPAQSPWFTVLIPSLCVWLLWMPAQRAVLAALGYRYPILYAVLIPLMLSSTVPLVATISLRSKMRLVAAAMLLLAAVLLAFVVSQ